MSNTGLNCNFSFPYWKSNVLHCPKSDTFTSRKNLPRYRDPSLFILKLFWNQHRCPFNLNSIHVSPMAELQAWTLPTGTSNPGLIQVQSAQSAGWPTTPHNASSSIAKNKTKSKIMCNGCLEDSSNEETIISGPVGTVNKTSWTFIQCKTTLKVLFANDSLIFVNSTMQPGKHMTYAWIPVFKDKGGMNLLNLLKHNAVRSQDTRQWSRQSTCDNWQQKLQQCRLPLIFI